jgi:hypothetical protein
MLKLLDFFSFEISFSKYSRTAILYSFFWVKNEGQALEFVYLFFYTFIDISQIIAYFRSYRQIDNIFYISPVTRQLFFFLFGRIFICAIEYFLVFPFIDFTISLISYILWWKQIHNGLGILMQLLLLVSFYFILTGLLQL